MTFPEPSGPGFGDAGERDVVGPRVLVGVQMINISRLSTDPGQAQRPQRHRRSWHDRGTVR